MEDAPDYPALGLGPAQIPDLIRMATDPALLRPDPWPDREGPDAALIWAPVHAWLALGRLRAEAAIGPLLDVLVGAEEADSDVEMVALPGVFAEIGPAAMPGLTAVLADASRNFWLRSAASSALTKMAGRHPEIRDESVALIAGQLAAFPDNGDELNALLVSDLLKLKAVEAAPLIERAFAAGAVAEAIVGDWPLARYELGLGEKPPPRRFQPDLGLGFLGRSPRVGGPGEAERRKDRNKARNKLEKKSRKQNRKRSKR